ncbi:hypothetical protein DPMN_076553 [Dreissena polymorpha]|uniref:Uncharacterized protein n=1 Tax=Dreissena polymorpha TaxID=45954 RepID=A0A9D4BFV4_DREPO|nr:hypothetical protein DPMN_076553 [Dreissena polymorpha]
MGLRLGESYFSGRRKTTTGEAWYGLGLGFGLVLGPKPNPNWTNVLTKFHEDRTRNAFTRQRFTTESGLSHFTMRTKINILTKFHKDWMKTVTSTVYTSKLLTDAHTHIRTPDITRSHKLTMSLRDSFGTDRHTDRQTDRPKAIYPRAFDPGA